MATATRKMEEIEGALRTFEVRVEKLKDNEVALSIWQYPMAGWPEETGKAERIAGVKGIALHVAWDEILTLLRRAGLRASVLSPAKRQRRALLPEPVGVKLALLVAAIAPLRKIERIERIADAIGRVSYEEACYWYAHARSEDGRRALKALRILLAPE